jgi:preprotein translocase subunit SecE
VDNSIGGLGGARKHAERNSFVIREFFQFLKDAWEELKKVSWLSRPQMIASTWLVVLLVIVFAIYVGVIDLIITRVFAFII